MLRLVRSLDGETDVVGLVLAQRGELDTELADVSTGDLLVELLGQHATITVSSQQHFTIGVAAH